MENHTLMPAEVFLREHCASLTEQQKTAVCQVEGQHLLLAVPGSGKTTVLVSRLAFMQFCAGIPGEQLLTLTYTVAAAKDMKNRYMNRFPELCGNIPQFRTINGICAIVIAYYARLIGKESFALESDEKKLNQILSGLYREIAQAFPTEADLRSLRALITYIKNQMLSTEQILELQEDLDFDLLEIYRRYTAVLRKNRKMDYDDQMIYALNILKQSPPTLEYFRRRYPYISVDEAQDTSKIQHTIIQLLAGKKGNLFMVGDEDQSIYGFRAAYPQALLGFKDMYPKGSVLLLETNFRSDEKIVEAAQRFISKNKLRHKKTMKASRSPQNEIQIIKVSSRADQYVSVLKAISEKKAEGSVAVLYRDNESAIPLVDVLDRHQIPFQIRNSELTFFSNRIVNDIRSILMFAMDPSDTELFLQIYYKIGTYLSKQSALEACEIAEKRKMPILDAAIRFVSINPNTRNTLREIKRILEDMSEYSAAFAIDSIMTSLGYSDYIDRMHLKNKKIELLKSVASRETTIRRFLERMDELEVLIRDKKFEYQPKVILSTIHSSKGLEYDTVYLLDVKDGIFPESVPEHPGSLSKAERETFEEERRLFYVGVTRAKNRLLIFQYGSRSSFVKDLVGAEKKQKKERSSGEAHKTVYSFEIMKEKEHLMDEREYEKFCDSLGEGVLVIHKMCGKGVVTSVNRKRVVIEFEDGTQSSFALIYLFKKNLLQLAE